MKFDLLSDLHIDVNKTLFLPDKNEGSDILVVAGDFAEFASLRNLNYRPFHEILAKYDRCVYVAGNHEFYGANYQAVVQNFRDDFRTLYGGRVVFLHGDAWEVPDTDIAFVGGTLFTDMNEGDETTINMVRQCMADFLYITYGEENPLAVKAIGGGEWDFPQDQLHTHSHQVYGDRRICTPRDYMREHRKMLQYFENECDRLAGKRVVLVTHHAMSEKSVMPKFALEYHLNGGYRSRLDWFFEKHKNVKIHCHGHMHQYIRYDVGAATVYCNPAGYKRYGETPENYGPVQIEV